MKKISAIRSSIVFILISIFFFQACVKDNCRKTHSYTFYEPVYKTSAAVRANIKSNSPREIQNPGKLYIYGQYIFLNEIDKGIHVINNANPSQPKNIAFIDIPGNMDIAVKENTLYADLYSDFITLDISNPENVQVKKIIDGVFPNRIWGNGFVGNTSMIVVDWVRRDTSVIEDCSPSSFLWSRNDVFLMSASASQASGTKASSPVGIGGSMARFTIASDRLYTVTNSDLGVFNISAATNPSYIKKINIGWNIETIYPFGNKLFVGSQNGMFVYDINNPDNPVKSGQFSHVRSCDPVIADSKYAYVTLRSGTTCTGFTNQLEVLELSNFFDPVLVKVYPMTNPHGLSKDDNIMFICDGKDGLKAYDASNVNNLKLIKTISGIETYDVIAYNKNALVVAKDGLYQYDYSDTKNIHQVSKIGVAK